MAGKPLLVDIDKLLPADYNPRKISKANLERLKKSLEELDYFEPIIVNKDLTIISGHQRIKSLRQIGYEVVEVLQVDVDKDVEKKMNIAANSLGLMGEWDYDMLAKLLDDIDPDVSEMELMGFSEKEVSTILDKYLTPELPEDVNPDEPDLDSEADSIPGEIYVLGTHLLMCGDSTDEGTIRTLMKKAYDNGISKPDLCLTDPPYSVDYGKLEGGDKNIYSTYVDGDAASLLRFMEWVECDMIAMTYPVDKNFLDLAENVKKNNYDLWRELVWVKDNFTFHPGSHYQQMHEPILIFRRNGKNIYSSTPATAKTVHDYRKSDKHQLHPTQRPMGLWLDLLNNHCPKKGVVYDPFAGSGTTMIAAEQTGRTSLMIELSPHYCDVIRKRWEGFNDR